MKILTLRNNANTMRVKYVTDMGSKLVERFTIMEVKEADFSDIHFGINFDRVTQELTKFKQFALDKGLVLEHEDYNNNSIGTPEIIVDGSVSLAITTTSLPSGDENEDYSQDLASVGGNEPYSYSVDSGTLPTGLALSSSGTISGTPTTTGTYNFTVKVTDRFGAVDTKDLSIVINV